MLPHSLSLTSIVVVTTHDSQHLIFRTSYDASTKQHWLSVYRPKFNAKYLLKQGRPAPGKAQMMSHGAHVNGRANQTAERQIKAAVDQMVLEVTSVASSNK